MSSSLQRLLSALRSQQTRTTVAVTRGHRRVSIEQVASFVDLLFPDKHCTARAALTVHPAQSPQNQQQQQQHRHHQPKSRNSHSSYDDVHAVSFGWLDTLAMLELARHADVSEGVSAHSSLAALERAVAVHVLNVGRFPANVEASELVVALLQRWRELGEGSASREGGSVKLTEHQHQQSQSSYAFPPSLAPDGCRRLAYHLSLCSPARHPRAWEETLALYHHLTQQHTGGLSVATTPNPARTTTPSTITASRLAVATTSDMAAVRHTVLVTMLRSGQWVQALRFFRHALYQRDMPDAVSTGFLVQALGQAGRIAELEQIYTLCVKLVIAQTRSIGKDSRENQRQQQQQHPQLQRLRKQWGTTLSMAMAAVAEHHPQKVAPMLEQLRTDHSTALDRQGGSERHHRHSGATRNCGDGSSPRNAASSSKAPPQNPLVLLDGNFLAAVQRVLQLQERERLLESARGANLLDFFKIVRGLVAKGRLDEALLVFTEGVNATPPLLSRKEIGSARLLLLHGASVGNVARVVRALHTAGKRNIDPLRVNDAEVEAILSKAVYAVSSSHNSNSSSDSTSKSSHNTTRGQYWTLCIDVMRENYREFMQGEHHPRRRPSLATLSFLMRIPTLPWEVALQLANRLDSLPATHARPQQANSRNGENASKSSGDNHNHKPANRGSYRDSKSSVPVEVLILNAAAALLTAHGQHEKAEALAARAAQLYGGSPSADSLLRCDAAQLRQLLVHDGARVDPRVLHHLLRTASSREASPIPRALEVISLVMEKTFPTFPRWLTDRPLAVTNTESSGGGSGPSWLAAMPASVHCETIACVRRCITDPSLSWQLTASYLTYLTLPSSGPVSHGSDGKARHMRKDMLTAHYSATWEAVITIVGLPAGTADPSIETSGRNSNERRDGRLRAACDALAAATVECDFLPPAHMLLPNQMDRLLPAARARLNESTVSAPDGGSAEGADNLLLRCAVAQTLVRMCWQLVEQRYRRPADTTTVEPVVLHGLLKLCCRVGEHRATLAPADRDELERELGGSAMDAGGLPGIAARLLEYQAMHNGLRAVSSQSIHLLYNLCAVAGQKGENGECDPATAACALQATRLLLALSTSTAPPSATVAGTHRRGPTRGMWQPSVVAAAVLPKHYTQFSKLFGWELGLQMWYETFPKDVLLGVAHSPAAVNFCLSLEECS